MSKPKIPVTGATGKTGGAVVTQLLEKGWPVRAIVRSRDARSEKLDRMGVETFVALLGIYPVLTGEGKAAPVSNEDMARVVVAVLMDPERHAGKSYRPTGPKLLSGKEMAEVMAKVVGRAVIPINLPFWIFLKVAQQQRIDPILISGYRHYVEEMKRGTFALDGGVNNVVEELTGAPAESFETTTWRYAAMTFAQQTRGNRLKAFINFNLIPFYPGYYLERWDRQTGFPIPPNPSFSIDDAHWQVEHSLQMARQPLKATL